VLEVNGAVLGRIDAGGTLFAHVLGVVRKDISLSAVHQNCMNVPGLLQPIRVVRIVLTAASAILTFACNSSGIAWTDPMTLPSAAADGRVLVDNKGRARVVTDTSFNVTPAGDPNMCTGSVQAVRQDDGTLVAVWWSVRRDSSAVLFSAVSSDGGTTWRAPLRVDTADVSVVGCARPTPSIAASSGFVHVAYSMRGREGVGIFYAHSMTRGQTYEVPLTIIYGDHLSRTAIAADRGVVAVAYEDPNGAAQQIGLAISRDWGHIFGDRYRGSTGVGEATTPQVAVAGHQVAVAWMQGGSGERVGDANARATRVVRVGRLQ
jgi:hypothetical protein